MGKARGEHKRLKSVNTRLKEQKNCKELLKEIILKIFWSSNVNDY